MNQGGSRMQWLRFGAFCVTAAVTFVVIVVQFGNWEVKRLRGEVEQLEKERGKLVEYVQRLGASRRVAQVEVLKQQPNSSGQIVSTLQWQELGEGPVLGRPQTIDAIGKLVYFEALVLKFTAQHVAEGDPERGVSLALFRRIFGDQQAPETAVELDRTARPTSQPGAEHEKYWQKFWEFVDQPKLAEQYGVRVAQIEAPAIPARPGDVWEVELDAAGGLNLKKLATR